MLSSVPDHPTAAAGYLSGQADSNDNGTLNSSRPEAVSMFRELHSMLSSAPDHLAAPGCRHQQAKHPSSQTAMKVDF